jgi:hypothetical protein
MSRSRRKRRLAGLLVGGALLLGLAAYLVTVGLDKADKLSSGIAAVLALAALLAPYLLPVATPEPPRRRVSAAGAGAVAVGGTNSADVRTDVVGTSAPPASPGDGVEASGPGSVAIGGDSTASIDTHVTGPERQADQ